MKTVVITGSARGLGFEMAKVFRRNNVNVVISDLNEEKLETSTKELEKIDSKGKVEYCICDVTKTKDINNLIKFVDDKFNNENITYRDLIEEYKRVYKEVYEKDNDYADVNVKVIVPEWLF